MRPIAGDPTDLALGVHSPVNIMLTALQGADRATWARGIHDRSARRDGPFVAVCGYCAPSGNLPVGGRDVDAWFEQAAGGTLFIDRVGDLSPEAQDALLRRLTAHSDHTSGAAVSDAPDRVRVIAGSNRSLRTDLARGAFREALFYRLNLIHLNELRQHVPGEDAMKARDIMSTPPHTSGPHTDLATVAKIMWDHDCGFVPVIDPSGAVAGVVTDRDICIATATRRLLPEHISAAQAMTTPIHACLPDDSIGDVLATMTRCQVRRLPVVDASGRLQGIVSLNDIVLASNDQRGPQASDIVSTMAAICAHRHVQTAVA
jgi:CBS domain-containing protein